MNNHEVEQIIQFSRELEGVGVDIGDDHGDHAFMKTRLLEIKQLMEHEVPGTLPYARLVDRYNTFLYVLMSHLEYEQTVLQPSYEIEEHLILLDYLRYRNHLKERGPYKLSNKVKDHDIVALVKVISAISLGGPKHITVCPLEVFKGILRSQEQYKISMAWRTVNEAKTYLAFINPPKSNETIVCSSKNWIRMVQEGDVLYLDGEYGPIFWPVDCVQQGDFKTLAPWESVREWLVTNCLSKNAL